MARLLDLYKNEISKAMAAKFNLDNPMAIPRINKIVVEGVNRVYKHMRPSQKNPQGGRLSKEMPIDVSNVMLVCTKCNRGVRVGHRFTEDGQKQRYCKSCGQGLGNVGPRKPAHAAARTKP